MKNEISYQVFRRPAESRAFSLMELLVVVAIVAVLMGLGGLAFSSISSGRDLSRAGADLADSFSTARAHAMSRNMPVEVVLKDVGNDVQITLLGPDGAKLARDRKLPLTQVREVPADTNSRPFADVRIQLDEGAEERFVFNSRGEMRQGTIGSPNSTPLTRSIEIGLARSVDANPSNFAAVQIRGLTGAVSLYQP